jgi:hypothetical protein
MTYFHCVFEDDLTLEVIKRLFFLFQEKVKIGTPIHCHGCGKIRKNINAYNKASVHHPFFIIVDLDTNACAPSLIETWLPSGLNTHCIFRVAVREIESWLFADRDGLAKFLAVPITLLPRDSETIEDPKRLLLNISRRSRKREIREGLAPLDDTVRIGPDYNYYLSHFVRNFWDIDEAQKKSQSLARTIEKLRDY